MHADKHEVDSREHVTWKGWPLRSRCSSTKRSVIELRKVSSGREFKEGDLPGSDLPF